MAPEHDRLLLDRLLAALRAGEDLRHRKVRRLRAAIRARHYENELKFQVATDRLADDLLDPPADKVPSR